MTPLGRTDGQRFFPPSVALILVLALFALSVLVVGLKGDFPLNDDWSYALPVRSLVHGHGWRPTNWSSPNLLTDSLWIAPFCALTDCSFASLRLSTVAAAVILALFSFLLFERARNASFPVLASLVLVVFNPIGYSLSYTIMTDVVYAMMMTASAYFFIRSLDGDSRSFLILATLLAIVAILCRQIGVCVPLGYAVVRLLQKGSLTRRLSFALPPLAACVIVLLAFPRLRPATQPSSRVRSSGDNWIFASPSIPYDSHNHQPQGILSLDTEH